MSSIWDRGADINGQVWIIMSKDSLCMLNEWQSCWSTSAGTKKCFIPALCDELGTISTSLKGVTEGMDIPWEDEVDEVKVEKHTR